MLFFRDLKQSYPVYLLDKVALTLTQGKVIAASLPHIDMNAPTNPNISISNPTALQMVVDITIEVDGKTLTYTMPEASAVTYAGNVVLATDKEGLLREVEAMKNVAEQVLSSVDKQREIVNKATALLADLNPTYKQQKETDERFGKLESSVADIKDMLTRFVGEYISPKKK